MSAVIVFLASFLAWMVRGHHKGDWKGLPDEDTFAALWPEAVTPADV